MCDRIWYVPQRTATEEEFIFPGWSHKTFFNNSNPVSIEYCSGNGAWIAAKAMEFPFINWVAVEKKFVRARQIWAKIKNLNLDNLIVICGEGFNATKSFFKDNSLSHVYVNFPDPWPKTRHAKHRIIQPEFLSELRRCLEEKGKLTVVTDDEKFSSWVIHLVSKHEGYKSLFEKPYYVTEQTDYGTSFFEDLWREKGLTIRYHQFQKVI